MLRKFKFHSNPARIRGTLHRDQYTIVTISRSLLLRMRNISYKRCRENQNTHIMFNDLFRKSYRLKGNVEKCGRAGKAHMKVWRMCIECWVPKPKNTQSEYVILIAFPLLNGCTNAPQCYLFHILPVLLSYKCEGLRYRRHSHARKGRHI
jgi:hypothetical protein